MIPRGQPFPSGPATPLCCPSCLAEGLHETLVSMAIFALGPHERTETVETPFYRYRCPRRECGYAKVHLHLLRGRA